MTNTDYKNLYEDAYKRAKNLDSPFYRDAAEIIFPELKATFMEDKICEAIEYAISSATHEDGTIINGITREQALEYFRNKKELPQETTEKPDCGDDDIVGKVAGYILSSLEYKLKKQGPQTEKPDCENGEEEDIDDIVDKLIESIRGSAMLEYQLKKHSINPEELVCRLEELKGCPLPVSDKDEEENEWSDDDKNNLNRIAEILVEGSNVPNWWKKERLISKEEMERLTDWLKTLRPQPKQDWSKEDDLFQHNIIAYLEFRKDKNLPEDAKYPVLDSWIDWLKNIKHRQYWKPTEEQLRAVFDASERNDKLGSVLRNLYNELRKL